MRYVVSGTDDRGVLRAVHLLPVAEHAHTTAAARGAHSMGEKSRRCTE